jgi:hypothetical protein
MTGNSTSAAAWQIPTDSPTLVMVIAVMTSTPASARARS